MEMLVRNAEGNLTQSDRDYAAKKLGRLDRYFHQAHRVEMVHREEKLHHCIEVTVFADHYTLRGEVTDESVTAAIDKVAGKLEKRLRRLKTKLVRSHRRKTNPVPEALLTEPPHEDETEAPIAEYTHFSAKPMSLEEAHLQMELLDHPFFPFLNQENSQFEVLYKTSGGRVGLMTVPG
jgi:putative sigma-54 modulation protein